MILSYFESANELLRKDELDRAVLTYYKAIEENPNSAWCHYNLGSALTGGGNLEQAVAAYRKAIELNPTSAWYYDSLGTVLFLMDSQQEAVDCFSKAIELYPNFYEFYNNLARSLAELGNVGKAIANFHRALELKPNDPETYYHLGNALSQQERWQEALAAYNQSLQFNPYFAEAYLKLGNVKLQWSEREEAIACYYRAYQLNPNLHEAYQRIVTMKSINSQLRMLDYPVQNLLSSNEQLGAKEISIDAAFNLTAEQGFYDIEYGQSGAAFRWTGPNNTFYFDLLLDREEPKELILKLVDTLKDENIDNLRCLIDDQEVLLSKEKTRGLFYIKGIVPKRASVGWTRISFVVPSSVKISEINPESLDRRSLGVAFSDLTIKSLDKEISIDAAFNLMAEQGFYDIEYGQSGAAFRWTGPNNTFYFDLLLDRGEPKELILKLVNTLKDENIDNLRCLIDDQEVLLSKEKTRGLFYIKGIVPKRASVGCTRISFVVPSQVKNSEINPESLDRRSLGVAFSDLTVKSLDQEYLGNFEIN